jgi:hypothetical protein
MKKCNCEKIYEKMQHKKRMKGKLFQGSKRHNFSKKINGEKSFEIFKLISKRKNQNSIAFVLLIPKLHDLHMSKLHARNKTIMYYGL